MWVELISISCAFNAPFNYFPSECYDGNVDEGRILKETILEVVVRCCFFFWVFVAPDEKWNRETRLLSELGSFDQFVEHLFSISVEITTI